MSKNCEGSLNAIGNIMELFSTLKHQLNSAISNLSENNTESHLIEQIQSNSINIIDQFANLNDFIFALEIEKNSKSQEAKLLREVNIKLVERIKTLEDHSKINDENKIKISSKVNAETQTDNKIICKAQTQSNSQCNLQTTPKSHHSDTISTPKFKLKSSNARKVIIYKVPSVNPNSIVDAISNQLDENSEKIKLVKLFTNADNSSNYVFQIPCHKALQFIQSSFVFNNSKFKVQYFVNVLRCFKCQRLGHSAKFCRFQACCSTCSSNSHESMLCSNKTKFCINCASHNIIFCTNYATNHPTYAKQCQSFRSFIHHRRKSLEALDKAMLQNSCISPIGNNSKIEFHNLNESTFNDSGIVE